MNLTLTRKIFGPETTIGDLYIDGVFSCYTLEDRFPLLQKEKWTKETAREHAKAKISGMTCIPSGEYQVVLDMSTRFKRVMPHVLDVPLFDGIRIHTGNTSEDTGGCILVGRLICEHFKLGASKQAYVILMGKLECADKITIKVV